MKKKGKQAKKRKVLTPDLPQNIIPIGERVLEDKNIYIHRKVYAQIHKFAENKTENEHGGILVGRVLNEMGKENTIIEGFIEAKYNNATPTTLTFTHETWDYFHEEIDRKYKDKKIVGWIHTHPNFGIFLSENDKFIQENFFTDENQVAYVVDPIQRDEGFFFWIDGKLERCPGFYLYDKNGVKIKNYEWGSSDDDGEVTVVRKSNSWIIVLLIVSILFNIASSLWMNHKIEKLENQVEDQDMVLKYGILQYQYTGMDVSGYADLIREELDNQKKMEEELRRQMEEQEAAEAGAEEQPETEAQPEAEVQPETEE